MSTADRSPVPRGRPRGTTLVEAVATCAVLAGLTLVVGRILDDGGRTQALVSTVRETIARGQGELYRLRGLVASSRRLYSDDAVGREYLAALRLVRAPPIAGSRLPVIEESKPLGPDEAGSPRTGNMLLFATAGDPVPCSPDPGSARTVLIERFRFVCLYLASPGPAIVRGGPPSLDLVEWRSVPFASWTEIARIADPLERARVATTLRARYGIRMAWDPSAPAATAFRAIALDGTIDAVAGPPGAIHEDLNVSRGAHLVASGTAVARDDPTSRPRTARLTADPPAAWGPNGFEVKIVGPSGARKVWMRMTVERQASRGFVPAQETIAVVSARDV